MSTTAPTLDTETETLDALDFEPALPCDRKGHPKGEKGCMPNDSATWRVLIAHTTAGCGFTEALYCDGGLRHDQKFLDGVFTQPPGYRTFANCHVCKKLLNGPSDLLIVIGEV